MNPQLKPSTQPLKAARLWLPLLLLPIAAGCAMRMHHHSSAFNNRVTVTGQHWPEEDQMLFRYQIRDGQPALESDRVVLVFHGMASQQQQLFHFQGAQQAVQIAGSGTSSVSTTCSSGKQIVTFRSDYANGTNTIHFGGQQVRLTDGGRLLLVGDQRVDLSEGRKVVQLKSNKATVE